MNIPTTTITTLERINSRVLFIEIKYKEKQNALHHIGSFLSQLRDVTALSSPVAIPAKKEPLVIQIVRT